MLVFVVLGFFVCFCFKESAIKQENEPYKTETEKIKREGQGDRKTAKRTTVHINVQRKITQKNMMQLS